MPVPLSDLPDAKARAVIPSRPVELEGRLVGLAVHASASWHFVAVDPVLEDLHGAQFRDPAELSRVAALVLHRARGPQLQPARGIAA